DPAVIIHNLGNWALWGVALILFIECAIFPVLPGDSLLFTVGMFIAMNPPSITFGGLDKPMVYLVSCLILSIFAVLGNVAGYWIGHFIGPKLFKPREGFWGKIFDPKYVDQTHELLGKYGNRALVLARFVPFVRTFITLIAGIGRMDFKAFITWTAVGGVIWSFGVTALGYFLGNIPFIANNIDAVLIAIVLVSVLPMAWEYLRARREKKATA
ncbi:MAG TPA: hypothetical protein DEG88_06900, partial [Propionibacteriaceae bacterium]|nr:hypothetical protein [Propionibacteriaceae bacterium]HBY23009.1 hypothetical protein [Propionibacteriaceae bacterium]